MNNEDLKKKAYSAVSSQWWKRGYVTSVDVLLDMGILTRKNYNDWKNGRIPYLEKACSGSLNKLALISKVIRSFACEKKLKPSFTYYKQNGKGGKQLRFSKSGDPGIERHYATHYVDSKRIAELKKQKEQEKSTSE